MLYLVGKDWKDLFDIIIVSANKPRFFEEGTTLREVDTATGNLKTSHAIVEKGKVFAGGSISVFDKSTMVPGNQVLYIGDHIFADIMRSKKTHGWRTLLVVRELAHEVKIWQKYINLYYHLLNLEWMRAELYRGLDSSCETPPDSTSVRKKK